MRLTLLIFLFTVSSLSLFAQGDSLYFEETIISQAINPGESDIPAETLIVNPTSEPIIARWIRIVNDLPSGWNSAVCDNNLCYPPTVDSASFTIPANGTATMITHMYPEGPGASAQVSIRVIEVDDRSNTAVATYSFEMVSSSFGPNMPSAINLFPNPTSDDFSIQSDQPLSQVVITNMLGKVVRIYLGNQETYNISDLPNGIYLASMRGLKGDILKTIRLSKRMTMP